MANACSLRASRASLSAQSVQAPRFVVTYPARDCAMRRATRDPSSAIIPDDCSRVVDQSALTAACFAAR